MLIFRAYRSAEVQKSAKGQLISKCPFGVIVLTKKPTKKFDNFCPRKFEKRSNHKIKAPYNVFNTLNSPYNHMYIDNSIMRRCLYFVFKF